MVEGEKGNEETPLVQIIRGRERERKHTKQVSRV